MHKSLERREYPLNTSGKVPSEGPGYTPQRDYSSVQPIEANSSLAKDVVTGGCNYQAPQIPGDPLWQQVVGRGSATPDVTVPVLQGDVLWKKPLPFPP